MAQFKPFLVACNGKNLELVRVPDFGVDFFEVMFAIREYLIMPSSTSFTDEDAMFHLKVS